MSSFVPFDDARTLLLAGNVIDPALIHWPNEPFVEPTGEPPAIFLSIECVGDLIAPIEMTGGAWEEQGCFYVHVNTPAGFGTDEARKIAKNVSNLYRDLPPRNVVYRGGSIGNGQPSEPTGHWWQLTVSIDWIYQDQP